MRASDPIGGAYAGNSSKGKGKRSKAAGFFSTGSDPGRRAIIAAKNRDRARGL